MPPQEPALNPDCPSSSVRLAIREILESDSDPVIDLLVRGFPRARRHWEVRLERLRKRATPLGTPQYGYILEVNGTPVGLVLVISSQRWVGDRQELFSNLSCWYGAPAYRSHATQLFR